MKKIYYAAIDIGSNVMRLLIKQVPTSGLSDSIINSLYTKNEDNQHSG